MAIAPRPYGAHFFESTGDGVDVATLETIDETTDLDLSGAIFRRFSDSVFLHAPL